MATTKRTQKEIEKDCNKIKEAAKTAVSIRDIERETNLSYAEIKTTLLKHPIIFKRIKEQLAVNKKQAKIENQRKKEEEKVAKAERKSKKESKTIIGPEKMVQNIPKKYVIDASITGIKSLRDDISKICATKSKIILTSTTIKELEKMQKFRDTDGIDARYILAVAAENSTSFETVLIDENFGIPDDCIVHYCAENKESVILLTSDKTMALKARMYDVQVHYLKQDIVSNNKPIMKQPNSKIRTLIPAKRVANKLLISTFHTYTCKIYISCSSRKFN